MNQSGAWFRPPRMCILAYLQRLTGALHEPRRGFLFARGDDSGETCGDGYVFLPG